MTIENSNVVVRLSIKDWVPIIGIALTVLTIIIGSFIHHDRLLTQLIIQQESTGKRLDKIETKLENTRGN
jgi:uncharacterized membrane-anchored protein YhcB (DUF1043 family)